MPTGFSHSVDYTFDCAVSSGELTADVPMFLKCVAPGDPVIESLAAVGQNPALPHPLPNETNTQRLCRKIVERTDALRAEHAATVNPLLLEQIWIASMQMAASQAREVSQHLAHCEAMRVTNYGEWRPRKTLARQALGRGRQRQVVRDNEHARHFVQQMRRLIKLNPEIVPGTLAARSAETGVYEFDVLNHALDFYNRLPKLDEMQLRHRRNPAPTAEQRTALRRAIKLADALVGPHALHSFLKGDTVHVLGADFAFAVKKQGLFRLGHGAIGITVCDTDLTPLADLCVYFKKTPAIDQLVALRLHCDAGMDADVVYDANVIREFPAAAAHDGFRAIRDLKREDSRLQGALRETARRVWIDSMANPAREPNTVNQTMWAGAGAITSNGIAPGWVTVSSTTVGQRFVIDANTRFAYVTNNGAFTTNRLITLNNGTVSTTNVSRATNPSSTGGALLVDRADGKLRIFIPQLPAPRPRLGSERRYVDRPSGRRFSGNLAYEHWSEHFARTSGLRERYAEALALAVTDNRLRTSRALLSLMGTIDRSDAERHDVERHDVELDDRRVALDHGMQPEPL